MSDILFHRFPGEKKHKCIGSFLLLDKLTEANGFVVSSFDKSQKFSFKEMGVYRNKNINFYSSKEVPFVVTKTKYLEQAESYIDKIKSSEVDKAILSRVKKVDVKKQDLEKIFDDICLTYPNAFVYLISSSSFGTWLGASPEVLLKVDNKNAFTMSLAGTKNNKEKEWTTKELEEQGYVTKYIKNTISNFKIQNLKLKGPYTHSAGPVFHLRTDFDFIIEQSDIIRLLDGLHPTPAIAGLPVKESVKMINQIEKHSRSLYSGFIGRVGEGKSDLFVNLRCCQIIGNQGYLYLGGGLTKDSIPEDEWLETENKSMTLINILHK